MNPSANGWIRKLLAQKHLVENMQEIAVTDFYNTLRSCGFIYGSNVSLFNNCLENGNYTEEELY